MDERIISLFKDKIQKNGMSLIFVSKQTEIPYQRLVRIFNLETKMTASELLIIARFLGISSDTLMNI